MRIPDRVSCHAYVQVAGLTDPPINKDNIEELRRWRTDVAHLYDVRGVRPAEAVVHRYRIASRRTRRVRCGRRSQSCATHC